MGFGLVIVFVAPERFPGGQKLRIAGAIGGGRVGGLERVAGESVEFVVDFVGGNEARWVGVIVDGFDFLDFGEELRVGGLGCGC